MVGFMKYELLAKLTYKILRILRICVKSMYRYMKIHGLQKKIKLRKTKRRIIYNGESLATTHGSANSKKSQTATTENSSVMHQQTKTDL